MAIDLQNRVCVITGAGRGIGAALVRGFAARGAQVVATDIRKPDLPDAALCLPWDVSDPLAATGVFAQVEQWFGRVDAFVANAGIYPQQPWDAISPDDWRHVLGINLDGAWYGAQAAARLMQKHGYGKIVFVTSIEAELGVAWHAHYVSSKAAVIGLTRSLARSLGPHHIRVNAVMPGAIRTEGEHELFTPAQTKKWADETQCIADRLDPPDVEPSFAFLCSSESDAITGQVLCVDHGAVCY